MSVVCLRCTHEAEVIIDKKPYCRKCALQALQEKILKSLPVENEETHLIHYEGMDLTKLGLFETVCSCGKPAGHVRIKDGKPEFFCTECFAKHITKIVQEASLEVLAKLSGQEIHIIG